MSAPAPDELLTDEQAAEILNARGGRLSPGNVRQTLHRHGVRVTRGWSRADVERVAAQRRGLGWRRREDAS